MANPTKKQDQGDVAVAIEPVTTEDTKQKLQKPRLYKVLFHNDDFTTMEFVVLLLIHVFHHSESDAQGIMLHIHQRGVGIAGVFTFEVAETKVAQVMELADKAEFPLLCTLEPADEENES